MKEKSENDIYESIEQKDITKIVEFEKSEANIMNEEIFFIFMVLHLFYMLVFVVM